MIGMTLKNAIHEIIKKNPTATFLVDGDTLRGDIRSYKCPNSAKFISCVTIWQRERWLPSFYRKNLSLCEQRLGTIRMTPSLT